MKTTTSPASVPEPIQWEKSRASLPLVLFTAVLLLCIWGIAGYVVSASQQSVSNEPPESIEGEWIGPVAHYTRLRVMAGGKMDLFTVEGSIARKGGWEWSGKTVIMRFSEWRWFEGRIRDDRLIGTLYELERRDGIIDKSSVVLRRP